jgi:hypothetical protein
MIQRLQRALEHIEELSPEAQEDLAEQIEEPSGQPMPPATELALPARNRAALAAIGPARDLRDDDEFAALDRIRQ